jgi:hypothetical protein
VVEADLADRHQPRVVAVARQRVGQAIQVLVLRGAGAQRVDAQPIRQAMAVGQRAVSKLEAATAGSTSMPTPAVRARATAASRSGSNSAASRWQWVSIQGWSAGAVTLG